MIFKHKIMLTSKKKIVSYALKRISYNTSFFLMNHMFFFYFSRLVEKYSMQIPGKNEQTSQRDHGVHDRSMSRV